MTILISNEEKSQLDKEYPDLKISPEEISGLIEFRANYDREKNLFRIIDKSVSIDAGLTLIGKYKIKIREREKDDGSLSRLPALYIDGVDTVSARHINKDGSACLCSPLEEREFLPPNFSFLKFFKLLVIPFLYGQVFYDREGCWPWSEYSHGIVGLLESYLRTDYPLEIPDFLNKLSKQVGWDGVRMALLQKSEPRGHIGCFCPKAGHIRSCHPEALKAILKLRKDIRDRGINLKG